MALRFLEAGAEDLPEVVGLVNGAYRGQDARAGWTHEADLLGGQRTDVASLSEELSRRRPPVLLCLRESEDGPILACAMIEMAADACVIGMLTVSPRAQDGGLGRAMLERAEAHARRLGAARARMTVLSVREALIAWYERRGYRPTGETKPFPYGEDRFGLPRRDDLRFVVLEKALP